MGWSQFWLYLCLTQLWKRMWLSLSLRQWDHHSRAHAMIWNVLSSHRVFLCSAGILLKLNTWRTKSVTVESNFQPSWWLLASVYAMLDSTSAMDSTTIYQTDAEVRSIRVLVFGDQSSCSLSKLQPLLLKKDNPYLTSFIDQVNHTLRHEVARLPTAERQSFPAFSSIQNLVSRVLKADKKNENAALESTLATVYQLCCFIR